MMEKKIAESEVLLQETKDEINELKAKASKEKKAVKEAMDKAKQANKDAESLLKEAEDKLSLANKLHTKAEKEYASAMDVKAQWKEKIQDLKQRLEGVI